MVCVFDALISEAKSLINSYTKIVDAKYPELNSVDNICKLKRDALASDIVGADDFAKRFAALKSHYETNSKCAANVKQAFRDVVLTDMTQPPEILKSMNDSIEGDINRLSQVQNQVVDDTAPQLALVYKESLFQFCPWSGRAANSFGVSPLRLECGRLVL